MPKLDTALLARCLSESTKVRCQLCPCTFSSLPPQWAVTQFNEVHSIQMTGKIKLDFNDLDRGFVDGLACCYMSGVLNALETVGSFLHR